MATLAFNNLGQYDVRSTGNLASAQKYIRDFANGGFFIEDVDNFHLVQGELSKEDFEMDVNGTMINFEGKGELHVKGLDDETNPEKIFLTAGVERRYLPQDGIAQYYNGVGEKARVVYLTVGLQFDVSAYEHATPGTAVEVGDKVKYDTATKKWVVDPTYDGSADPVAFEVRRTEADVPSILGQPLIRLVVTKGV